MIIGSMTGRELFDIFKKDKPMLEKFAIEKQRNSSVNFVREWDDTQLSVMISRRKTLPSTKYACL